jgi:3-hydroxyisobutyrate dehydrogenase-like beta-hydroxyacid dehydrogenase
MDLSKIGIIGYGEVGKIFATGLKDKPGVAAVVAWDVKFTHEASGGAELAHAAQADVQACASMQTLCEASSLIISAVTAFQHVGSSPRSFKVHPPEHGVS